MSPPPAWITVKNDGVHIAIYAQPGASRTEICGIHDGRLKIKVQAPPVEGAANRQLQKFLQKKLRVSKRSIILLRGDKSRQKTFLVKKATPDEVLAALSA